VEVGQQAGKVLLSPFAAARGEGIDAADAAA